MILDPDNCGVPEGGARYTKENKEKMSQTEPHTNTRKKGHVRRNHKTNEKSFESGWISNTHITAKARFAIRAVTRKTEDSGGTW